MGKSKSIFIFRRDLRLEDNTGLIAASRVADEVIPCFICDPNQITDKNKYKSNNSVQFMVESLRDLDAAIRKRGGRLHYFYGDVPKVLRKLIRAVEPTAVYVNRDYTPYSRKRDAAMERVCREMDVEFMQFADVLLNDVGTVLTKAGTPYKVYTPFYNTAKKMPVAKPVRTRVANFGKLRGRGTGEYKGGLDKFYKPNPDLSVSGGRAAGLKLISAAALKHQRDYEETRNDPAIQTTMLSAHNKFGTLSIREVYHAFYKRLGAKSALIPQLYWRDFYLHLGYFYPEMYEHRAISSAKYDKIAWKWNAAWFKKWTDGKTGFPIVDAGMRQMNETGFMHNRVRMIAATFLIKDLLIDWKRGEQYFARRLTDYARAQNAGNWAWCAGVNPTSQDWNRIFNPWTQTERFDKDAEYIKRWIPELADVPADGILNWDTEWDKYRNEGIRYPKPMVDHDTRRLIALKAYKKALGKK